MTPAVAVPELRVPPVDPDWLENVPAEHIPTLITHLAVAVAQLAARDMALSANDRGPKGEKEVTTDGWLKVDQAAERYRVSASWLYRHSKRLGFGKKLGAKLLISVRRLEDHLDRGGLR